jgi:hypothetical protein
MSKLEQPLDADDLMILAERIEQLSADDAEWVNRLLQELLRARAHEGELLAGRPAVASRGRTSVSLTNRWHRSRSIRPNG